LLERDLQNYLFEHPEMLFPGEEILEKLREVCVDGKRIDLLIRTAGSRYIIELKAVPLTREHIGQVIEYYGQMRRSHQGDLLRMVLVAPSIPDYWSVFLEEIGVRCIEMSDIPSDFAESERVRKDAFAQSKREKAEELVSTWLPNLGPISYDDMASPVSKRSLAMSHRMLRDSLRGIREKFAPYEIKPIKMLHAGSQDSICERIPSGPNDVPMLKQGGAWWAYAFGESESMPKNDLPNISAMAMPWGFDLTVNAELRTSQTIMRARIAANPVQFNHLVREHAGIHFQAILKLERQPRFYFWIPLVSDTPGSWDAMSLLRTCDGMESEFSSLRNMWIGWIEKHSLGLTKPQALHMNRTNKLLNLALRLARPFCREDDFWSLSFDGQCRLFVSECARFKPLIDFLR
jgi:hypothetical protein